MAMAKQLNWKEQMLDADGLRIRYLEAGNGDPIIVFPAGDDAAADPILEKLAESHRIISLNLSSLADVSANQLAEKLPSGLTCLGIGHCSVIGIAAGSRSALALAIAASERIDKLILISPQQISDSAELLDLAAVTAATLVLVGTRNSSAAIEAGRLCRERIHSCHLSLVYGACDPMTGDRPEACLNPIIQFMQEGEQFIIFRESQVIRP